MLSNPTLRSDKLREYCGVIAVYRASGSAAQLAHRGLFALQHRGQESAGIATIDHTGELHSLRGRGLVSAAIPRERVADLPGELAVGHVRYSTVPVDHAENIQPFLANTPFGRLAIAHNGNFKNAPELTETLRDQGALLSTTMDTELLVHLLTRSGLRDFPAAVRSAATGVVGSYSLTLLCGRRLYGLRDPHGVRPLVLGELPASDPGFVIASETCALHAVGARYLRELAPGELCEIGPGGVESTALLPTPPQPSPCIFELVYFSRPDSEVFSQSVQEARVRMGVELAKADAGRLRPDIVVPVPDSGVHAAVGYAQESGVPFAMAIVRSHYVGRTFILPSQDARTHSIHLKLSVVAAAVAGKRVLLVDDSLVRGNTAQKLVQMVRDAGAAEIWMRLASPPIAMPCYLGIDTPTREELLINQVQDAAPGGGASGDEAVELVRRFVGADDLRYLSLEGLRRATLERPFCVGCMNGRYPV